MLNSSSNDPGKQGVWRFATERGAAEHFIVAQSDPQTEIQDALEQVALRYDAAMSDAGLGDAAPVFARVYLSDIENQKDLLARSGLFARLRTAAVSVVGQTPLEGGPAAILAYHVGSGKAPLHRELIRPEASEWRSDIVLHGKHYQLLCNAAYCGDTALGDSHAQTNEIFASLNASITSHGMTFLGNAIRTWIFVRDVDNNYKGMVRARRDFFAANGLTQTTRFLASTGIEGQSPATGSLVSVDALSVAGLQPEQIVRMEAPDHMSPTIDYGVTFERGLRVRFGDRSHLYISGTASIDHKGETLYPGDIRRQTRRMMENVEALLGGQGAGLGDLSHLIVYLRDPNARESVLDIIRPLLPAGLPVLALHGAVCRPAWLVEVEGIAITGDSCEYPPYL